VYSQSVLLALVDAGMPRDEAYALVQAAAAGAWDEGASFRAALEADAEVAGRLDRGTLATLFDPTRYLANLVGVLEKLEKLPVESVPGSDEEMG
jgi:adenylosuccinate lyase